MKKLLTVSCLLSLAAPLTAAANRVHDVSFQVQAEEAVIAVAADGTIDRPRVRSERGRLRVWFPGMTEKARLSIEGDGAAIGQIALRPSGNKTALLEVEVHSDGALPQKAIRAQADGDHFYLRIARSALPELSVDGEGQDIPVTSDGPMGAVAADSEEENSNSTGGRALSEDLGLQRGIQAATAQQSPRPLSEIATAKGPMESGEGQSTTTLWVMAAVASALGGGYLYLRKTKQRMGDDTHAEIEILGSRRIGPRQQLLLIRALGEDHLLLLNGDKAEHLAAVRAGGAPAYRATETAAAQFSAQAAKDIPAPRPAPRHEPSVEEDRDFGELLAAAETRNDSVSVVCEDGGEAPARPSFEKDVVGLMRRMSDGPGDRLSQLESSPAVQGLLRLRREVG